MLADDGEQEKKCPLTMIYVSRMKSQNFRVSLMRSEFEFDESTIRIVAFIEIFF